MQPKCCSSKVAIEHNGTPEHLDTVTLSAISFCEVEKTHPAVIRMSTFLGVTVNQTNTGFTVKYLPNSVGIGFTVLQCCLIVECRLKQISSAPVRDALGIFITGKVEIRIIRRTERFITQSTVHNPVTG